MAMLKFYEGVCNALFRRVQEATSQTERRHWSEKYQEAYRRLRLQRELVKG